MQWGSSAQNTSTVATAHAWARFQEKRKHGCLARKRAAAEEEDELMLTAPSPPAVLCLPAGVNVVSLGLRAGEDGGSCSSSAAEDTVRACRRG